MTSPWDKRERLEEKGPVPEKRKRALETAREGSTLESAAQLWHLFVAFFRANLLGYGGGPAVVPLIEAEVVEHYGWMTRDEFAGALAAGNALPGPIATKMAGFVGYQTAGWAGAAAALLATVAPTAFAMVALAGILQVWREHPLVRGMLAGVRPVVWVLFVQLAIDYVRFATSGWLPAVIAAAALAGVYGLHLHPAWLVLGGLVVGAVAMR
ncbi:MAG: chromate transporter [Clostridia bacterium]|nr:chromate transporter [Clostridia bacterium]